ISPNTAPSCRYHPTCSSYALEAIEKHGAIKGGIMGAARIIRCNSFVEGGVDEVPDHFTIFRNPENLEDEYIPEFVMPEDKEAQKRTRTLMESHEEQLKLSEGLPSSVSILQQIADVGQLSAEEIKRDFSQEEMELFIDMGIFPDF